MYKFCIRRNLKPQKELGTESIPCDVGIGTRAEGKQHNTIILVRTSEYNNAKLKAHCNKSRIPKMPNRCCWQLFQCFQYRTRNFFALHTIRGQREARSEKKTQTMGRLCTTEMSKMGPYSQFKHLFGTLHRS